VGELNREDGRKRIEQEDNLINHRVSWLIGSQSFLLTAFVLLRNNPSYYDGNLQPAYIERTSLLVYVIAGAGLLIAFCSSMGVCAAFMAVHSWRKKVKESEREFLTSDATLAHLGGLAAVLPGPVLASIWVILLKAEWSTILSLSRFNLLTPIAVTLTTFLLWLIYTIKTYGVKVSTDRG
jgi:hypothetical protein